MKAASEAREKSEGCRMRRMRLIDRLLSTTGSVQDPELLGQDHAPAAEGILDDELALVVGHRQSAAISATL